MTEDQIEKWREANLILGGSWIRRAAHETLGAGASYEQITQTMISFKDEMIARSVHIEHLHDVLQSHVDQFDMRFHEFLRYEKTQEFLSDVVDAVVEASGFSLSVDNENIEPT